jgi:hypothetical protein
MIAIMTPMTPHGQIWIAAWKVVRLTRADGDTKRTIITLADGFEVEALASPEDLMLTINAVMRSIYQTPNYTP